MDRLTTLPYMADSPPMIDPRREVLGEICMVFRTKEGIPKSTFLICDAQQQPTRLSKSKRGCWLLFGILRATVKVKPLFPNTGCPITSMSSSQAEAIAQHQHMALGCPSWHLQLCQQQLTCKGGLFPLCIDQSSALLQKLEHSSCDLHLVWILVWVPLPQKCTPLRNASLTRFRS